MVGLNNAIVHLNMHFNETSLSTGTGVFYKKEDRYYIITAWHNVTGLNTESLNYLDANNAVPNYIWVTFKHCFLQYYSNICIKIPLYDDDKALFYIHPDNWPRIDVVAIPFNPLAHHTTKIPLDTGEYREVLISLNTESLAPGQCPIRTVQDFCMSGERAKTWLDIVSVTEEVFIPSYPHNITDDMFSPVWKRATLASNPRDLWNRERKFLIDSASSSGMSGASVFYYDPSGLLRIGASRYQQSSPVAIFAGVYVGRLGVTNKADPQVGTVWHPSLIDEIIDGATYDCLPPDITINESELERKICDNLSQCSPLVIKNILNEKQPTRHYIFHDVMKTIKGRASPENLMRLILHVSENYNASLKQE